MADNTKFVARLEKKTPAQIRDDIANKRMTPEHERIAVNHLEEIEKKEAARLKEIEKKEAAKRQQTRDERQAFIDETASKDAKETNLIAWISLGAFIVFGIFGVYYSQRNSSLTEETIKVPESSMSEMADIGMKDMSLIRFEPGAPATVVVRFSINGKTKAKNVSVYNNIWIRPTPLPENPRYGETQVSPSKSPMSPGFTFEAHVSSKLDLTKERIDLTQQEKLYVYVYGRVDYEDISGQRHFLKYCGKYNPPKKKFDFCLHHNESK